jgi:hypothetical protein
LARSPSCLELDSLVAPTDEGRCFSSLATPPFLNIILQEVSAGPIPPPPQPSFLRYHLQRSHLCVCRISATLSRCLFARNKDAISSSTRHDLRDAGGGGGVIGGMGGWGGSNCMHVASPPTPTHHPQWI